VTVRAVRGDYRLDGDPARLARALKLGPDEHARIWQALWEMADHAGAATAEPAGDDLVLDAGL
jgi:hypothetical protein